MKDFLKSKWSSRKFWAFVIAVVALTANWATGQIDAGTYVVELVKAAAAYQLVEAAVDAARGWGGGNHEPTP